MTEFEEKVSKFKKDRKNPTPAQEIFYLGEVHDVCPLCGKKLIEEGERKVNKYFEIAHIFPCNPTKDDMYYLDGVELYGENSESMHNKIALCKNCHKDYDNNKTKEKYNNLLNIKKKLEQEFNVKQELAELGLEDEIKAALIKLQNLNEPDLQGLTLSYEAVCVDSKIKNNLILKNEITANVISYFMFIHNFFIEQCSITESDPELILNVMRAAYLRCKREKMNQDQIFETLKNWVKSKTSCTDTAASIIISYFVQNCEVYETTK